MTGLPDTLAAAPEAERCAQQKFVCPACGGEAQWNPAKKALICAYCGTESPYRIEAAGEILEHDLVAALKAVPQSARGLQQARRQVRCQHCQAISFFSAEQQGRRCDFCGSTALLPFDEGLDVIRPQSLLPFKVAEPDARNRLRQWYGSRFWAPNALKNRALTDTLQGVYLPYWTFDAHGAAHYTAEAGTYYRDSQNKQQVRWRPVSGQVAHRFDDTLVCGSRGVHPHPRAEGTVKDAEHHARLQAGGIARDRIHRRHPGQFAHDPRQHVTVLEEVLEHLETFVTSLADKASRDPKRRDVEVKLGRGQNRVARQQFESAEVDVGTDHLDAGIRQEVTEVDPLERIESIFGSGVAHLYRTGAHTRFGIEGIGAVADHRHPTQQQRKTCDPVEHVILPWLWWNPRALSNQARGRKRHHSSVDCSDQGLDDDPMQRKGNVCHPMARGWLHSRTGRNPGGANLIGRRSRLALLPSLPSQAVTVLPIRYVEPVFRPPSEAESLILPVTDGCSWNRCTFCEMYTAPQKAFRARDEAEVVDSIRRTGERCGAQVRRVFLADGDALVLPTRRLLVYLEAIRTHLPAVHRVSSY